MNLNTPVSEIMTKNVLFVHYNNTLGEVERLMKKKNIRHVPVLREGKLSGIVSLTDLERLCFVKSPSSVEDDKDFLFDSLSVEDVMMGNPISISSNSNIEETINILIKKEFHALPVVENEILVGIVTTTDLMKYMLQHNMDLANN